MESTASNLIPSSVTHFLCTPSKSFHKSSPDHPPRGNIHHTHRIAVGFKRKEALERVWNCQGSLTKEFQTPTVFCPRASPHFISFHFLSSLAFYFALYFILPISLFLLFLLLRTLPRCWHTPLPAHCCCPTHSPVNALTMWHGGSFSQAI